MNKKVSFPTLINLFNLFSVLCIVAGFMFSEFSVARIALYSFFISYFIEIFTDSKLKAFKLDKTSIYFITIIVFFLLAFVHFPFEQSNEYRNELIERRLSLLGFGIVGVLGVNQLFKFKYFLYVFIATSVFAILFIFSHLDISEFIRRPDRSDMFTATRILYVNSHMKFNFYLNVSIICIWYLLKKHWSSISIWKIGFVIPGLTLLMYVLSITEGRSGFIAGTLLMLSFVFLELVNRWRIIGVISVLLLPLIFVGIVSTQRRMNEEMVKREPRLFLWESAWNVAKEKPVLGYGISDAQATFNAERIQNQDQSYENYAIGLSFIDSHNQYLQTTMEFGFAGLILLLFLYMFPIFISDKRRKFFAIYIIFLCLFQSVFDMFITGTFSLLFGILMIMILRAQSEPGFSLAESDENKLIE